ncbi:hypothetical protein N7495_005773 [Penicillium taxi]|uniref:uncharacterized protein n=1 Tax=Penicillium taxi TaxID=168475 RepID=UPI0025453B83|nr:uncharacterized protein N7495_005773 [Penicillium taxi]KAJ5894082.1 hypothetical protein N7495_005773 [Penicillium taxi]
MTKKKRNTGPTLQELLERPFCYYCERDFDDMKILTGHQKAKHFKCDSCNRRLNTAGGLAVHMLQVHKSQLEKIEDALPHRAGIDVEIFGMEGMPPEVLKEHQDAIIARFNAAEAQRTGNFPSSKPGGQSNKRPKLESISDMKMRLAAHRAKRAEEAAAGSTASTGDATPVGEVAQVTTPSESSPQAPPTPGIVQPFNFEYAAPTAPPTVPPTGHHFAPVVNSTYQAFPPMGGYPMSAPQIHPSGYTYSPHSYGVPAYPVPHTIEATKPSPLPLPVGLPQRPNFASPPNVSQAALPSVPVAIPATTTVAPSLPTMNEKATVTSDKPAKKAKAIRLVFSSNDISPEELMAQLPRFANSS